MVTISHAVSLGTEILKNNNIDVPRLDAEIILSHILNLSRLEVIINGQREIDEASYTEYLRLIGLRANGMPAAYITGCREFMGLNFVVRPGVLIPRGDTEVAVERALDVCQKSGSSVEIADVGCGSGAIGISIAKLALNAKVTLIDISDDAVNTANVNAALNGVESRVTVYKGDLLKPVYDKKFDIVISNPPYVESGLIPTLQREVRDYEPRLALDGGEDGLNFYRCLTPMAAGCLKAEGMLIYEIGCSQASSVEAIMSKCGFRDISLYKDLAGLDRCITGRK